MKMVIALSCVLSGIWAWTGQDWPQFRGPNRDGISSETHLLKSWPEGGPPLLWQTKDELGRGYASLAIYQDRIYTTGMIDKQGYLFCLDLKGNILWKSHYGLEWSRNFPGTRSTPLLDDKQIFIFSGQGEAFCYNLEGKQLWKQDLKKTFEADEPGFGWSESGILSDDHFIVCIGGIKATVVALDRNSGKTAWTANIKDRSGEENDVSAYADSIVVERGGMPIYISRTYDKVFGLNAKDGTLLWDYNTHEFTDKSKPIWDQAHPNAPVYRDGDFFISSGYNMGGAKFRLSKDGKSIEKVWENLTLDSHHHGYVLVGDNLYGSTWINNKKGNWASVNWTTGELNYDTTWLRTKGAIIYADGMLYCYEEAKGNVALVPATPKGFEVVSTFQIPKGSEKFHWSHPAIADGKLFIRYGGTLRCFNIKG